MFFKINNYVKITLLLGLCKSPESNYSVKQCNSLLLNKLNLVKNI